MNFEEAYKKALETKCPMYLPVWSNSKYFIVRKERGINVAELDEDMIWQRCKKSHSPTLEELVSKSWEVANGVKLSTAVCQAIKENKYITNNERLLLDMKLKPTEEGLILFKNNVSQERKSFLENDDFLKEMWFVIE